jgi:2-polyprenyl-3-methyl-5-hydroxy-6-metoxy-1,4-benzoquinol methylase
MALVSTESLSGRSLNGRARSVAKKLLWPASRFFDPRFIGIHEGIDDVKRILTADANASNEAATYIGRSLDTILAHVEEQARSLDAVRAHVEEQARSLGAVQTQVDDLHTRFSFDPGSSHSIDEINEHIAGLLNYAASHEGFAAQAHLWFNPPLLVAYEPQNVALRWVNERVVEVPYAFRALCRIDPNATVLDVGATESSVCLSLATLGYDVTAIDPRPNPLSHERLRTVVGTIEEWDQDATFDAVLCLSTIEHIGTSAYEQDATEGRVDLEAMKRIRALTRPEGLLVLTTAVGRAAFRESGRVYDRAGLDELLEGWDVADCTLVQRRDATTWTTVDESLEDLEPEAETVAMVTATNTAR